MYQFTANETAPVKLTALKQMLQDYANEQWLPEQAPPQQAVQIVREMFMRQLKEDLEKIELKATRIQPPESE